MKSADGGPGQFTPARTNRGLAPSTESNSAGEKIERDSVPHCLIARDRRMQVVAAVEAGQQLIWMLRVAYHGIEVDHCVEVPCGANPLVHRLAVGLGDETGMVVV